MQRENASRVDITENKMGAIRFACPHCTLKHAVANPEEERLRDRKFPHEFRTKLTPHQAVVELNL